MFTPPDCKNIRIGKFEFVAKNQFFITKFYTDIYEYFFDMYENYKILVSGNMSC